MATIPDDESCAQCRYFIDAVAECHRHPPSVWLATAAYRAPSAGAKARVEITWPSVAPADWCGDFLKIKNVVVPPIVAEEK